MNIKMIIKKLWPIAFIFALLAAADSSAQKQVLAIMPVNDYFNRALGALKSELGNGYTITVVELSATIDTAQVCARFKKVRPAAIILMDNKAISLCKSLIKKDTSLAAIPKFGLMALQLGQALEDVPNSCGISFEVPAYTLITRFRAVSEKDFSRVGVFYRKRFSKEIEEGKTLLAKEQISLIGHCLDCEATESINAQQALDKMKKTFKDFVKKDKVEVLWLISDNLVVNTRALQDFWLKRVQQSKLPVVASIENLVNPSINAGIFAADPDYEQLGVQSAGQVVQVLEEGTLPSSIGIEKLISIKSVLNRVKEKEIGWQIRKDRLSRIDKVFNKASPSK